MVIVPARGTTKPGRAATTGQHLVSRSSHAHLDFRPISPARDRLVPDHRPRTRVLRHVGRVLCPRTLAFGSFNPALGAVVPGPGPLASHHGQLVQESDLTAPGFGLNTWQRSPRSSHNEPLAPENGPLDSGSGMMAPGSRRMGPESGPIAPESIPRAPESVCTRRLKLARSRTPSQQSRPSATRSTLA